MTSPFLNQTRIFQRRLFQYALESTGGDVGWAAGTLGISETFFRLRAEQLGGVLEGTEINADIENDLWDDIYEDEDVPTSESLEPVEEVLPQKPTQQPEFLSKIDSILAGGSPVQEEPPTPPVSEAPLEIVPQETFSMVKLQEEQNKRSAEFSQAALLTSVGDPKPMESRGRKPAVSPNPEKFMTRREVETLLGLSTTGVMRLRAKGDLSAIHDPSLDALLFDREQVEEFARKRTEEREAKKANG